MEKPQITAVNENLIKEAGFLAENYGLTRIAGELAALLFLEPGPLSIGEMSERLGVSKPSVSTNIRFLERWQVVKKVPVRNDRRDYYEFIDDLWLAVRAAFESVFQRDVKRLMDVLRSVGTEGGKDPAVAGRLKQAEELFGAAETVLSGLLAGRSTTAEAVREIPVE
ncbi:MAG TPA: MarR family transcriptional regulator [bacterium]|nr:MarR family transcriptional regulator [bacterium]